MRLIEVGDVDSKQYEQVLAQLDGNLLAKVQRSVMGRIASSSTELTMLNNCADASHIRQILALGQQNRPCPFCDGGPDSRVHWCHECPASAKSFVFVAMAVSAHLAAGGRCLWFRPDLRRSFAGSDGKLRGDTTAWEHVTGFTRNNDVTLVNLTVHASGGAHQQRN